jgi:two-component system nitrogen regulation response regulator GlnG
MARLLVVEDEIVLAKSIRRALTRLGHSVETTASLAEGERLFDELGPDLALLDMELPDGSGMELLARMLARKPGARVVIMTAYTSAEFAARARELGARGFLRKPLDMRELGRVVEGALEETSPPR